MRKLFTSALMLGFSSLFAQSFNGPESVDYDSYGKRYLVSNSSQGQILSYDAINDELDVFASGVGAGPHGLEVVGEELFACSGSRLKAYNLVTEEQTVNVNLGTSFANGITHKGNDIFITDFAGKDIYRYNLTSGEFNMYIENLEIESTPVTPNGIFYDDMHRLLKLICRIHHILLLPTQISEIVMEFLWIIMEIFMCLLGVIMRLVNSTATLVAIQQ